MQPLVEESPCGGKLLFRSSDMEVIEGAWSPKLFVVHEWPSEEAFRS